MPDIGVTVDGVRYDDEVQARLPLAHYLRARGAGSDVPPGCETGECGACTVLVDGAAVRSCLMLAVQVDGRAVTTAGGLRRDDVARSVRRAFRRFRAAGCARCSSALVVAAVELLRECPDPSEQEIGGRLAEVRCRCGGHVEAVLAVREAADRLWGAARQTISDRVIG
ncbi:2Fe-2S iron-sulfur cluster binding domain-containing protein [Thermobifida halotolerans]|uniref:2Fe-2S iron-sulfur cluster binding domain-containing protein n=1 Tax=Thermobifida halotolerans TaxID=483545 RepID=A0AA97LUH2_9ACTN|nr:2Fe-2S iron-sulfur cluster-binding protein [Thermobifida halotolerans]UOE18303.1 2Fe-2S iron-sulfur cluster binding domain-containing protein [Thermobifida halotolerans]